MLVYMLSGTRPLQISTQYIICSVRRDREENLQGRVRASGTGSPASVDVTISQNVIKPYDATGDTFPNVRPLNVINSGGFEKIYSTICNTKPTQKLQETNQTKCKQKM
jgi:hypothetical protein